MMDELWEVAQRINPNNPDKVAKRLEQVIGYAERVANIAPWDSMDVRKFREILADMKGDNSDKR